jgi:hypothetical protein
MLIKAQRFEEVKLSGALPRSHDFH